MGTPDEEDRVVAPSCREGWVISDGEPRCVPPGWGFVPSGDSGLTRHVKSLGPCWTVMARRGRRRVSVGVWTDAGRIAQARKAVEAMRASPAYQKRRAAQARRRDERQRAYVLDFQRAVVTFLDFAPCYVDVATRLAALVAAQATPVGSGAVGRTQRIPVESRAEAAVIAWLRHHTTAYDRMSIPRVKGHRRKVRRALAKRSRELMERYRRGDALPPNCPLDRALAAIRRREVGERETVPTSPAVVAEMVAPERHANRAPLAEEASGEHRAIPAIRPPESVTFEATDGPGEGDTEAVTGNPGEDPVMVERRRRAAAVKKRLARGRGGAPRRHR